MINQDKNSSIATLNNAKMCFNKYGPKQMNIQIQYIRSISIFDPPPSGGLL